MRYLENKSLSKEDLSDHWRLRQWMLSCALIFSLLNLVVAQEQYTHYLSESEFFSDLPAVESVTKLPQPRSEAPAAVTIIDKEMIWASGARDLADIFRLVPGFQVAFPRSHRPTVTYHGIGDEYSRRMQILIDGRSVYSALSGHVSWSSQSVAIEDIERIEVTRGPNSATYGANAFLATINIITRHTASQHTTSLRTLSGNNGISDGLIRYGTNIAPGKDIRISLGYKQDAGLNEIPDESKNQYINIRSDIDINDYQSLLLQFGASEAEAQEGFFNNPEIIPTSSYVDAHFEQVKWLKHLSPGDSVSVQFYHNYRKVLYEYLTDPIFIGPPAGSIQIPINFNESTERFDLEFEHTTEIASEWRVIWGAGLRRDLAKSESLFNTAETIRLDSERIFLNSEWKASPQLIVNLGGMLEQTDITDLDFSPRLAMNYHLDSRQTLRAAWSRAKRIPSLFEEQADLRFYYQNILIEHQYLSQGGLVPETMTSFEIGYLARIPEYNMTVDIRAYQDKISNFISEVRIPVTDVLNNEAFSYRNDGDITVSGVDLELIYRPGRESGIILTHSFMDASASTASQDAVPSSQERELSVPKYTGSLLIMHKFDPFWYGSLGYYYVSDMVWLSNGDEVSKYDRTDLRISRKFQTKLMRGEISATMQNVGGEHEEFRNDQTYTERYFITLEATF